MSGALLLSGILASPAVRRKRRADGAVFAVARIYDTDRGAPRHWTVFINQPSLIEQFEELRRPARQGRLGAILLCDRGQRTGARDRASIAKEQRVRIRRGRPGAKLANREGLNDAVPF